MRRYAAGHLRSFASIGGQNPLSPLACADSVIKPPIILLCSPAPFGGQSPRSSSLRSLRSMWLIISGPFSAYSAYFAVKIPRLFALLCGLLWHPAARDPVAFLCGSDPFWLRLAALCLSGSNPGFPSLCFLRSLLSEICFTGLKFAQKSPAFSISPPGAQAPRSRPTPFFRLPSRRAPG